MVLFRKLVILRLGAFEGRVGHDIPCDVDANEQEQHRAWKMALKSGSAETKEAMPLWLHALPATGGG